MGADDEGLKVSGVPESRWMILPHILIQLVGLSVGVSLALVCLKLDIYTDLPWWVVCLPIMMSLLVHFLVFTVAILLWVRTAVFFFSGCLEIDPECEFRLDMLFRTAKICFLGHGYVVLLMISLGLLLMKLQFFSSLPIVYPLLPLIVLGLAYTFLALVFKQPEVDSPCFFLAGMTLLGQSIMLVIKVDHMLQEKSMPWAVTFVPSWLTYMLLLIYCVVSPLQACDQTATDEENTGASSANTPYGGAEGRSSNGSSSSNGRIHSQLRKVSGIASWAIGWGLSQILLTLRLDLVYKVSWFSVITPALLGWILLIVFVTGHVTSYFRDITELLLATFCIVDSSYVDDQDPVITYDRN